MWVILFVQMRRGSDQTRTGDDEHERVGNIKGRNDQTFQHSRMIKGQKKANQRGRGRGRGGQSRFQRKGGEGQQQVRNEPFVNVDASFQADSQLMFDVQAVRSRFMTPEFKEQNGLVVDGRLLCRHFLWGRCIKVACSCH